MSNVIPRNDRAEDAVLGSCLIDPEAIYMCEDLDPSEFHDKWRGRVFDAMRRAASNGRQLDIIGVSEFMGEDASLKLMETVTNTPTSAHIETYAKQVKLAATRRKLMQYAAKVAQLANDMDVDSPVADAQSLLANLEDPHSSTLMDSREFWNRYVDEYEKRSNGTPTRISTGMADLDRMIIGLEPEKYYIVAGRPGMGKSIIAQQLTEAALKADKHVLFVSLEMGCLEMADRIITREKGFTRDQIKNGHDLEAILRIAGARADEPIKYLFDANLTTLMIRSRLKQMKSTCGVDLLVIDYAQLCNDASDRKEYEQQSIISKRLRAFTQEFSIPVLAVAQLSRKVEERKDKRPMLSDLRSSGQYEQDADCIMFMYRPSYYDRDNEYNEVFDDTPSSAELIVAKQRNGPTGTVPLMFAPTAVSFFGVQR